MFYVIVIEWFLDFRENQDQTEHLVFLASQVKMALWVQRYSGTQRLGSQVSCKIFMISFKIGSSLKPYLKMNECHIKSYVLSCGLNVYIFLGPL